jgi:glutathione S-transferase
MICHNVATAEFGQTGAGARLKRLPMRLYNSGASANGLKIRLLLGELGRACEEIAVDIFRGESRTPEFFARNPDGRVPVLETDDGRFIPESNAILYYLAEGTPFFAGDAAARAAILGWLFFEQNQLEPTLGTARYWYLTGKHRGRETVYESKREAAQRAIETLERGLRGKSFLVDNRYSIADIGLYAYTHLAPEAGFTLPPAVAAWCARVEDQPGWVPGPDPYPASASA